MKLAFQTMAHSRHFGESGNSVTFLVNRYCKKSTTPLGLRLPTADKFLALICFCADQGIDPFLQQTIWSRMVFNLE